MFLTVSDVIAISFGLPVLLLLRDNSFHHDVMAAHVEKLVSQNALRVEKSRRKTLSRYQADGISYLFDQSDGENTKKKAGEGSDKLRKTLDRKLEHGGTLAKYTFPECVEQNLTPEECKAMIEQMIDGAGGHEINDDVKVKIHKPRTPEELASSYWMAEVPTDIYGMASCNHNNGKVHYPFEWYISGDQSSSIPVEDVDCLGLSAGDCCVKIRSYGRTLTESGYDANGQCLSCFVHQEPLIPIKTSNGETNYLDCAYTSENEECEQVQLNENEVNNLDDMALERIVLAHTSFETFATTQYESCESFEDILSILYDAAVHIPPLSMKIGQLACSICNKEGYDLNDKLSPKVELLGMEILYLLQKHTVIRPNSKEHCIVIYTNDSDDIVTVPRLGGGIADAVSGKGSNTPQPAPPSPTEPSPTTTATTESPVITGNCRQNINQCNESEVCAYDSTVRDFICRPPTCLEEPSFCNEETELCGKETISQVYSCLPATCYDQPSQCDEETEVCLYDSSIGNHKCTENVCLQDPPPGCLSDDVVCVPTSYEPEGFECKFRNCLYDPSLCNDDEYCFVSEDGYYDVFYYNGDALYGYRHECYPYEQVGDFCEYSSVSSPPPEDPYYRRFFSGYCNPKESFCMESDSAACAIPEDEDPYVERKCVAFGEGSCSDENGELTNENCKDDEYCANPLENCRPRRSKGQCCSRDDECAIGLQCAQQSFRYIDDIFHDFKTCEPSCKVDDDCDEGNWCFNSGPSVPFCKPYVRQGSRCLSAESDDDAEERCDPSKGYCYDPGTCKRYYTVDRFTYLRVPQLCKDYGKPCASTLDCKDPNTEWCDMSVGFCKERYLTGECCSTGLRDDESYQVAQDEECEGDAVCQLVQPDWFSPQEYDEFLEEAYICH